MQRKYIIGAAVSVVLMAAVFAGGYTLMKTKMNGGSGGQGTVSQQTASSQEVSAPAVDEKDIVEEVHLMSNSLIIAGDNQVWGEEEVNKENIEKVEKMLDQAAVNTKTKKLREIVARWKQGDFSQVVDDHNYVWHQLGGTVGRASGADEKAVSEAEARMKSAGQ